MRNRAKCKLCGDILESFHQHDYVECKCKQISIDGGQNYWRCSAIDYANFLRIDDDGNEVIVTYKEERKDTPPTTEQPEPQELKKDEAIASLPPEPLIDVVDEMIRNIERLPVHAQLMPVNQYDYMAILLLFKRFLKD